MIEGFRRFAQVSRSTSKFSLLRLYLVIRIRIRILILFALLLFFLRLLFGTTWTSLHGWFYMTSTDRKIWRFLWTMIVLTSIGVASVFVYKATEDFSEATVVTTIHSTTVPLSEVYFPAVTVCNINQVRKSFFNDLDIDNNVSVVDLLYEQFYTGSEHEPLPDEKEFMKSLFKSETYVKNEFRYHRITSKGHSVETQLSNWTAYLDKFQEWIEQGFQFTRLAVQEPYGVMILQPQIAFDPNLDGVPYWKKIFGEHNWAVEKGAEVGKANGLSMLLDAETFDYTFHLKAGEGFKIAVHHHLDQPIMSIKELDISPGSVFQIAVTPTLMSTTPEAIERFSPLERGCYKEGELPLKYLPSSFYRYEMSNCLFEAAYERVLEECECTPSFHQLAYEHVPSICRGPSLTCMNRILRFIGKLNRVGENQDECLSACYDQINHVSVTSSDFPNRETFVRREEFCLALQKLNRTCNSEKRAFLIAKFPTVCHNIRVVFQRVSDIGENGSLCRALKWDPVRLWDFNRTDADIARLEDDIFQYAKQNLAVVNVYIKDPVVTQIMRDEKIPVIAFVANTGGLLGLCMGFSLVSVFEVLYHLIGALRQWWMNRISPIGRRFVAQTAALATRTVSVPMNQGDIQVNELARADHALLTNNGDCHPGPKNKLPCAIHGSNGAPSTILMCELNSRTSGQSQIRQTLVRNHETQTCLLYEKSPNQPSPVYCELDCAQGNGSVSNGSDESDVADIQLDFQSPSGLPHGIHCDCQMVMSDIKCKRSS
ncbi:hypothetical protein TCAL_05397 [Tigriopus californicus]|uniref:Uncharacterized protein n=1 Tax=Tigriopus californicus TaxID=6832 RepID=A0A553P4Y7_TIGCA|nr:hypothetical protein TCAL_05397 [Tigriopus californicus]